MSQSQIGLIGLAVMGANLARNIANKGFKISVFNRTIKKTTKFIEEFGSANLIGREKLEDFISSLETPRKIIIMVQAGKPVDMIIDQLLPFLKKNDIIIDCGNSNYQDTQKRFKTLQEKQIQFIGCGVSGGEEGALNGPSLMPGGNEKSWQQLEPIFTKIAAKDFDGNPCVTFVGENGAGHYIKMVHNGIEYGVMQLMAEAYDILRKIYKLEAPKIAEIFEKYNQGKLSSYLFEISSKVLNKKDQFNNGYLVDYILDKAGQKGTGTWTAIDALKRANGLSTITESVFARIISGDKEKRQNLDKIYEQIKTQPNQPIIGDKPEYSCEDFIPILEDALYAGMLSTYAQGYDLIQKAAQEENWEINLAEISRIWEGGCIIRAKILNFIHEAYKKSKTQSAHLFEIPEIKDALISSLPSLRELVAFSARNKVSSPAMGASLSYFDAITSNSSPANFIQALRDFFGAHTYQRTDKEGDFHTDWN